MSAPSSTRSRRTFCPSGPVWCVFSIIPRISPARSRTSLSDLATLTPPPFPRPPAWICAFTTQTLPPSSRAAFAASSTEKQGTPRGVATPYLRRISFAWYSWIFICVPDGSRNHRRMRRGGSLTRVKRPAFAPWAGQPWRRCSTSSMKPAPEASRVTYFGAERAAGHLGEDAPGDAFQACALPRARRRVVDEALVQPAFGEVEVEGAVLAHHRVHRPHARDVVAPSGRAPGHGNDDPARGVEALEGRVRGAGQLARSGQGLVDVDEHGPHAARVELGERLHLTRTGRRRALP